MNKLIEYIQTRPGLQRWLDIFFLALVTAIIVTFFQKHIVPISNLYSLLFSEQPTILFFQNILIVISGIFLLIKFGGLHPTYLLKTTFRYPPFWASALFAIFFSLIINLITKHSFFEITSPIVQKISLLFVVILINSFSICLVTLTLFICAIKVLRGVGYKIKESNSFLFGNLAYWTLLLSGTIILSYAFGETLLQNERGFVQGFDLDYKTFWISGASLNLGVLFAFICALIFDSDFVQEEVLQISEATGDIFESFSSFKEWFSEEAPLTHPDQDIFGYHIIAKRIAGFLLDKEPYNIGLLGSFGVGKSSIINLTKHYIKSPNLLTLDNIEYQKNERIIVVCSVDGWGLASKSVAKSILDSVLDKVKTHVDCFSVLGIPENYRKSLAGAKQIGGDIFTPILDSSHTPFNLLKRLDKVLLAANIKVIIFLEDLDRNSSDEIVRDEVPSLMDRMKKLKSFSCVLAIGMERTHSDSVIRICDHTENI
ncbi:MAG: P-loop NTPase fold protein [Candidatus Sericytochromatia bacterium]